MTKLPPPSDVVPYDKRELMSKRCKNVVDMPDMGRKYTDIITDRGHWVMENWLHWAETYAPAIAHNILKECCPTAYVAWKHLRSAVIYYMCSHGLHDNISHDKREQLRIRARDNMWTFARIAETMDVKLCNINLRLLTVHSYLQEQYTGPIMHTTEFWIERDIQGYKASVRDRVVAAPECLWPILT